MKKTMNKGKALAVGAGVAAIGVGALYLLGPNKKAHQKKAKALLTKMEKEVKSKAKQVKDATEPVYHKVVDTLADTYSKQYTAHEKEIKNLAQKLKRQWKGDKTRAKKTIKRAAKKATIRPTKK